MANENGASGGEKESLLGRVEISDKQMILEDGVYNLIHILIVVICAALVATAIAFVREFVAEIPLWVIFTIVWIAHGIIFFLAIRTVQLLFKSLTPGGSEPERAAQKWQRSNEKRISLAQFALYNLLWILGVSAILLSFDILLYLGLVRKIPISICLIPIYITAGIAVLNALVCRTTQVAAGISWIALLVFCILCTLKLSGETPLPWMIVVIPLLIILLSWLVNFIYILGMASCGIYVLKGYQIEAIILYLLSVAAAATTIILIVPEDLPFDRLNITLRTEIVIGTAFVAECLFFAGVLRCSFEAVVLAISRMGSDRPQTLVRSEAGWGVDASNSFEHYVLLGEVESTRPSGEREENSGCSCCLLMPLCGCCLNSNAFECFNSKTEDNSDFNT